MGKLPENFEDWRLPWTADEFDSDKAARLVFNARKGEEKAKEEKQSVVASKDAEIAQLKTDLDDEKARKSGTDEEGQAELKRLREENATLKAEAEKLDPAKTKATQRENDRLKVAIKLGLELEDVERLRGETYEEILEDGKGFAKRYGIEVPGDEDDPNDNPGPDGAQPPGQRPVPLRTGFEVPGGTITASNPSKAVASLPPLNT